jgi:hypothetical protein
MKYQTLLAPMPAHFSATKNYLALFWYDPLSVSKVNIEIMRPDSDGRVSLQEL